MQVSEFDFELPADRIAQVPAEPRDAARLLVYDRRSDECRHETVASLPELLDPGDLLVVNDTRVLPHRHCESLRVKEELYCHHVHYYYHWEELVVA